MMRLTWSPAARRLAKLYTLEHCAELLERDPAACQRLYERIRAGFHWPVRKKERAACA